MPKKTVGLKFDFLETIYWRLSEMTFLFLGVAKLKLFRKKK
jgi:hypothetical protein